jgi:hypothetical protein
MQEFISRRPRKRFRGQGIVDADLLRRTEQIVMAGLDFVDRLNLGTLPELPRDVVVYQAIESVDFPRDAQGELMGMIHPRLQGRDYQALNPGDAMFVTFNEDRVDYLGDRTVYPVFVNEAAYYDNTSDNS